MSQPKASHQQDREDAVKRGFAPAQPGRNRVEDVVTTERAKRDTYDARKKTSHAVSNFASAQA